MRIGNENEDKLMSPAELENYILRKNTLRDLWDSKSGVSIVKKRFCGNFLSKGNDTMTRYEKTIQLWQSFSIQAAADLDRHLDSFRILFAYNSSKIENAEVTLHETREVFENGKVRSFGGDPRTLFEVQNQKICYLFLLPKIVAEEPITIGLIKETHGILTAGTYDERRFLELGERPGAFKKHDYVTGRNEVGSLPEDVEHHLNGLIAEINETDKTDEPEKILKTAAYFHLLFENIHPFADGNGRVGRTIMNYFLMIHKHPPLIVYDDDRADYYAGLEHYDEHEDIAPLFEFFQYQLEKTWEKTLARHEKRLWREKFI